MRYRTASMRSGGALGWLLQRFTGLLLVVLLLAHFSVMHLSGGELCFRTVGARLADPLYQTLERVFLAAALWHGGYGLWLIVVDYFKQAWARMLVLLAFWTIGLVAFVLGWLSIISINQQVLR